MPLAELLDEFTSNRKASLHLFRHLPDEAWLRVGSANAKVISTRAMAFVIAGHAYHHMGVLRERYGVS